MLLICRGEGAGFAYYRLINSTIYVTVSVTNILEFLNPEINQTSLKEWKRHTSVKIKKKLQDWTGLECSAAYVKFFKIIPQKFESKISKICFTLFSALARRTRVESFVRIAEKLL